MRHPFIRPSARTLVALLCLLLPLYVSGVAFGRAFIDMGPKDQIAGHQPQAQIEIFTNDGLTSLGPASSIDDPLGGLFGTTSTLLVDTGASSVFLMNGAETAVKQNGYVVENEVLWIPGCGRSDCGKVGAATCKVWNVVMSPIDLGRPA